MKKENKIAHLQMIQDIITRMGQNSFQIKGWAIGIMIAIFSFAGEQTDTRCILFTIVPLIIMWFLDSYYYYRVGDYYGKDQPIKNMLWEQKYSEDELKNVMPGIWETMIIETIHELKSEISMIDTTDDFLMYMCDHDISYEDLDMWVRKTNEGSLVDELKSKMYGIGELLD